MLYGQSKPGRRYALINWNAEQNDAHSKPVHLRGCVGLVATP